MVALELTEARAAAQNPGLREEELAHDTAVLPHQLLHNRIQTKLSCLPRR